MSNIKSSNQIIQQMIDKKKSIEEVALYCVNHCSDHLYDFSKILNHRFESGTLEVKYICLNLIFQIFRLTLQTNFGNSFIKSFTQRVRYFLEDFSKLPVPLQMAQSIQRNVEELGQKQIFSMMYYFKLSDITNLIVTNANADDLDFSIGEYENIKRKYPKSFLLAYLDISQEQWIKNIYDTYCFYMEMESNFAQNQIDKENTESSVESIINLGRKQKNSTQDLSIKRSNLEKIIVSCHSHILLLKQKMHQQLDLFEKEISTQQIKRMQLKQ